MVPFIDIKRIEEGFRARWLEAIARLTDNCQFIGGEEVSRLEAKLRDWTSLGHAVTCANGTDALQLALRALGVGSGDRVLLPDATFWATFESIVNVGAIPVTVDVSRDDGALDFPLFEKALGEVKPKAAVIVHLYGWGPTRLADFRDLCRKHDVPMVEDGAQCFGAMYRRESIFAGAQVATTSFYPAKVLGAAGDGGAVFCSDATLASRVRQLSNHGRTLHYTHDAVGWNSRLDTLQAAFLNIALDYLGGRIASRRRSADFYRSRLPEVGLAAMRPPADYEENGYCNVVLVDNAQRKARLEAALRERGVGFANIYPVSISMQPGASAYLGGKFGGEVAAELSAQVLNLPLFPYMTEAELEQVLEALGRGQ
jgi:UDP-2-acetamido-2-deoxy-ribo-hexuluronate aminotransferase